jgi:hypothetical protein
MEKTTDVLMQITAEKDNSKGTPCHIHVVGNWNYLYPVGLQ